MHHIASNLTSTAAGTGASYPEMLSENRVVNGKVVVGIYQPNDTVKLKLH